MKDTGSAACDAIAVSDLESEGSAVKEIPRSSLMQAASTVLQLQPSVLPTWAAKYCKCIEDRRVSLYTPFADVSETLLSSLEDAEKTRGGLKRILTKVTNIAYKAYLHKTSKTFEDDTDQESGVE